MGCGLPVKPVPRHYIDKIEAWSYCRVSIKSTPLRDRDTLDEILVSSPCLEGRDKRKNLSGVAAF
jgi:hypothetical protein